MRWVVCYRERYHAGSPIWVSPLLRAFKAGAKGHEEVCELLDPARVIQTSQAALHRLKQGIGREGLRQERTRAVGGRPALPGHEQDRRPRILARQEGC